MDWIPGHKGSTLVEATTDEPGGDFDDEKDDEGVVGVLRREEPEDTEEYSGHLQGNGVEYPHLGLLGEESKPICVSVSL